MLLCKGLCCENRFNLCPCSVRIYWNQMWLYTIHVIQKDRIRKGSIHAWLTILCRRNSLFIFRSVLLFLFSASPSIASSLLSTLCANKWYIKPILKASFWLRRATWPMNILTKPWNYSQQGIQGQEPETQWLIWPFCSRATVAPLRLSSDNPIIMKSTWTGIVLLKSSLDLN